MSLCGGCGCDRSGDCVGCCKDSGRRVRLLVLSVVRCGLGGAVWKVILFNGLSSVGSSESVNEVGEYVSGSVESSVNCSCDSRLTTGGC